MAALEMIVAVFACVCAVLLTAYIVRGVVVIRRYSRQPACSHHDAVPVDTLDGERVAWLCPDCDQQLACS